MALPKNLIRLHEVPSEDIADIVQHSPGCILLDEPHREVSDPCIPELVQQYKD